MARAHSHRGGARKAVKRSQPDRTSPPDGAIYIGILMVGAFGVLLWNVLDGEWQHALLGFVIAVAVLVNLFTFQVVRGKSVVPWGKALARLPLRFVGFGTRGGKPVEAAHGSPRAQAMLAVSIATSAVVIAGLTLLIIP